MRQVKAGTRPARYHEPRKGPLRSQLGVALCASIMVCPRGAAQDGGSSRLDSKLRPERGRLATLRLRPKEANMRTKAADYLWLVTLAHCRCGGYPCAKSFLTSSGPSGCPYLRGFSQNVSRRSRLSAPVPRSYWLAGPPEPFGANAAHRPKGKIRPTLFKHPTGHTQLHNLQKPQPQSKQRLKPCSIPSSHFVHSIRHRLNMVLGDTDVVAKTTRQGKFV